MGNRAGLRLLAHAGVLLVAIFSVQPLRAAPANPTLTALVRGVDNDEARSKALGIETMEITVRLHGTIAETTVTAHFVNPGEDSLEGDFRLAMPAGSVVTGYALDVEGRMVDGVLVDQRKARLAYEERLRRNVDPGVGEVSRGYQFRTRIFPIAPGSGRTVRLRFATPLDPRDGLVLPLAGDLPVGRLTIKIEATGVAAAPSVVLPAGGSAEWRESGGVHRLSYDARQVRLTGSLSIAQPRPAAKMLVSRDGEGQRYFQVEDSAERQAAARPRSLAILWDRSLSRADDRLAEEIALVRAYLERLRPETVDLYLFDSSGAETVRAASPETAVERLRSARYGGASSLSGLSGERIAADSCLLFSDGLITIDRRDGFKPECRIFAIPTAPDADMAWLGAFARRSGGELLPLRAGRLDRILARLARPQARIVAVRSTAGAPVDFTQLEAEGGWRIVGPLPETGGIVVDLAGQDGAISTQVFTPSGPDASLDGAGSLWAADELGLRAAGDDIDRSALVTFARSHSVAGPDVSFVVLETGEDYARAEIAPPPNFQAEQRRAYDEARTEQEQEQREARQTRLADVLESWNEQKLWWSKRFDPRARPPQRADRDGPPAPPPPAPSEPQADGAIDVTGSRIPQTTSPVTVLESAEVGLRGTTGSEDSVQSMPQGYADSGGDIAVTASAPPARRPSTVIAAGEEDEGTRLVPAEWSPDRPYLTALKAVPAAKRERVLAEQQRLHGSLPAFWLDVSEYYYRAGRRAEALRLLLSALDLPTRDSETLAIVADRLMRYGETDRAIYLYERLAALEPDRPQPIRSLALALGNRGMKGSGERAKADLARAISLLTTVIMTPWDGDYEGIELVALMEVNRLIPHYRRLGGEDMPLDPRLIALLDVDLRVVIEWNTEETDLDLWVDEPNGERAMYNNQLTAIGGHMSEDMTDGYGPEEYLLRRALPGTYVIRADTYASDEINPNGPSRVTARLIRDFGRPTEREEVVDVELVPDEEDDEVLIGRLVVRPRP
jgi:tetratricopeptide (TPR) repeat protein